MYGSAKISPKPVQHSRVNVILKRLPLSFLQINSVVFSVLGCKHHKMILVNIRWRKFVEKLGGGGAQRVRGGQRLWPMNRRDPRRYSLIPCIQAGRGGLACGVSTVGGYNQFPPKLHTMKGRGHSPDRAVRNHSKIVMVWSIPPQTLQNDR